ncbi:NAD(P)-dependent alcohol dehydrogenase [Dickeya sp. ws52]|uniref:NAD(P)-dependent alcohol dehydrogenase n=1 Tax=Dickeya sp. ws52 TaxID=2576377 RepID=UPI0018FEF756|nr:NAD(P)-dependent alcohol dehydrogenase [Dickeya sp. ws52]
MAGAGLAAASTLAVMPGKVQAQESAAQPGNGPWRVRAWGNQNPSGPFVPLEIPRRALRPNDVLIDIMYCAICHSDIHIARQEWGPPYPATNYPCVPGHEIIGRVAAIGSAVTKFRPGDIAGAMIDSCGECENCMNDLEQYCVKGWTLNFNSPDKISGGYNYGGFSQRVVIPERFTVRIPPGMNLAAAAPLMCAGITTFSPLQHWSVEAGQRVGVIGMGGLGHLAVKLAVARRADVTVFTTTPAKIADAKKMGAREAIVWTDPDALKPYANQFDFLISTIPTNVPTHPITNMLRLDGTYVIVGAREPIEDVRGSGLWLQRRQVSASLMGGMAETQEFIDFCAHRKIVADIELIKPDQIDRAFARIKAKDVRYRFVVDLT